MKKLLFSRFLFSKKIGQNLYALDNITKIELTFAEQDWAYPLHHHRSLKKGDRHMKPHNKTTLKFLNWNVL